MKKRRKLFFRFFILNLINVGPFNKAVGPRKNPKLINVGPTFIPESRVGPFFTSLVFEGSAADILSSN